MPLPNNIALLVAVGPPYVALVAAVVLAFSAICRCVALTGVAAAIAAVNLVIQVAWYHFGKSPDVGGMSASECCLPIWLFAVSSGASAGWV